MENTFDVPYHVGGEGLMKNIAAIIFIVLLLWEDSFSYEFHHTTRRNQKVRYHNYGYQDNYYRFYDNQSYVYHNNVYQDYGYQTRSYPSNGYQDYSYQEENLRKRIRQDVIDSMNAINRNRNNNAVSHLNAWVYTVDNNINGAFAPQYSLMYKNYRNSHGEEMSLPASIMVRNWCYYNDGTCQRSKVMLKAWIPGFTDTATVTKNIGVNEDIVLAPNFNFNRYALAKTSTPVKSSYEFRVYNLANNRRTLFFSQSEPVTIQPVDVNGAEAANVQARDSWYSVWVTPNMDSVSAIHKQMERLLPENLVMAYYQYSADKDVASSSKRLVKALYNVLAQKGIRYVNNPGISSNGQKIKYPIQVLRHRQANCIEGVALFASVLESLGMHVYIVLIPDHAFLGWQSEDNENSYQEFLETTYTWNGATFEQALKSGYDQISEQMKLGNFNNGRAKLISIDDAREYGIMPNDIP